MSSIIQKSLIAGMVLSSAVAVSAAIELPNLFSSHMVLHRDLPVPIFGTDDLGEKVSVMFAGQTAEATVDKSGQWMLKLTPLQTAKTGWLADNPTWLGNLQNRKAFSFLPKSSVEII